MLTAMGAKLVLATAGVLTLPMQIQADFILVPNGNGNGGAGEAAFTVQATSSTNVELSCEVLTPTGGDDSFFIWFDNADKYAWHAGRRTSFGWAAVSKSFFLSAGVHTLHIGNREDGSKLRRLRISSGDAVFASILTKMSKSLQE